MKKKEINLSPEEIDYLLKGTIHWEDVLSRQQSSLRKSLDTQQKGQEVNSRPKYYRDEEKELRKGFQPDIHEQDALEGIRSKNRLEKGIFQEDAQKGHQEERFSDRSVEENDLPSLSGTKVYLLLSFMACIVLGTWIYFVFA